MYTGLMNKRFFLFLLLWQAVYFLNAQDKGTDTVSIDYQDFVESNFGLPDEQLDYAQSYESLFQFLFNPIDLNSTNRQELKSINVLSEAQIKSFFKHLNENGPLLTLYEVSKIPEFDEETVNRLLPYVTVRTPDMEEGDLNQNDLNSLLQRIMQEENNFLILQYARTTQPSLGFKDINFRNRSFKRRFAGSPDYLLGRFRVSSPKEFSVGLTFEKDPGEAMVWDPETNRRGFDFYSFHAMLQNKGFVKNILVGDYQLQFGQSLLLGAGFSYGKGSATVETARRSSLGIVPYTSSYESGFMRGTAATLGFGPIEITGFYSNKNIDQPDFEADALLDTYARFGNQVFGLDTSQISSGSTGDFEEYLSAIQTSGLHRTNREIRRKGVINEQVYGGTITYTSKDQKIHTGFTAMGARYDPGINLKVQQFNRYEFSGERNTNYSFFYDVNLSHFNLFGEAGSSKSGGIGFVSGLNYSPSRKFNSVVVFRDYERDFHSLYGLAFSENYRTINERGLYIGMKYNPSQKLQFSGYLDYYEFPWVTFYTFAPSQGYDYLFQVDFKPTWQVNMYLQYRHEAEEINVRDDLTTVMEIDNGIRDWIVYSLEYAGKSKFYGKTRVQVTRYQFDGTDSKGYAIIQDLGVSWSQFSANTQFSIFDADDLETSQYIFQRDVLYDFTVPFYQNQGANVNFLLQWDALKDLTLWAKVSHTYYKDIEFIGDIFDIFDIIEGNKQTDLKFQVMYRF